MKLGLSLNVEKPNHQEDNGNLRGKMQKIFQKKVPIMKKEGEYKQVVETDMNPKNGNMLNGVYETMSEIIGFDNVVKLYENFKGSQINFPTRLFSKDFVLQEALKAYDGTSESINLIATKYSYSERTIRKLLKDHLDSI